jgi:hypothetical protein
LRKVGEKEKIVLRVPDGLYERRRTMMKVESPADSEVIVVGNSESELPMAELPMAELPRLDPHQTCHHFARVQ